MKVGCDLVKNYPVEALLISNVANVFIVTYFTGLHTQKAYTHTGTSQSKLAMKVHECTWTSMGWAGGKEFDVRIGWGKYLYNIHVRLLGM